MGTMPGRGRPGHQGFSYTFMSKPLRLVVAIAVPPAIAGFVFLICTHVIVFFVVAGIGMWGLISTAIYIEMQDGPTGRNL